MQQQTTCFTYEEGQGIVQLIYYVMDHLSNKLTADLRIWIAKWKIEVDF
jgi:hypothetical protein